MFTYLIGVLLILMSLAPPVAAQGNGGASSAVFRFTPEAGRALRALWHASVAAKEERVACLRASIQNDTVLIKAIAELESEGADSVGILATASVDQCGPPEWSGTVHTHIALYTDDRPSSRFSAQDRIAMRLWYDRWNADGVFCILYSERGARCEADGVVGGMRRSRPRVLR
jgi:hypothetical protein